MSKYDKLDAAIITHIAGGGNHGVYQVSYLQTLAAKSVDDRYPEAWRIIDRRLQALRKAGRIKYGGQKVGWFVVEAKESA